MYSVLRYAFHLNLRFTSRSFIGFAYSFLPQFLYSQYISLALNQFYFPIHFYLFFLDFAFFCLSPLLPPIQYHLSINPLKPELNPICCLLALLAHHFLHISRIRVKSLTLRQLMSYIYIYIYIYIWSTYS